MIIVAGQGRRAQSSLEKEPYLAAVAAVERLDVLFVSSFDGGKGPFTVVAHVGLLTRQRQPLLLLLLLLLRLLLLLTAAAAADDDAVPPAALQR